MNAPDRSLPSGQIYDKNMSIEDIIQDRLHSLYLNDTDALSSLERIVRTHAKGIVDIFYEELLDIPETKLFLEHAVVDKNLKDSLYRWLLYTVESKDQDAIEEFIAYQHRIGQVHANVNINLSHFSYGIGIIKRELFSAIDETISDRNELSRSYRWINEIFDILTLLVSESYFQYEIEHESNELSLKTKGFSQNTALECERLRGSLLDWLRTTLTFLYQTVDISVNTLPKLQYSNFGLWVVYKAEFLSPTIAISKELRDYIDNADSALIQAAQKRVQRDEPGFLAAVQLLNEVVTKCSWFISSIVDRVLEIDTGMDPLTRVFNRRYVGTILRRQTEISLKSDWKYAVLMIDLDNFKAINDQYGHDGGDAVLKQFAEVLLLSVRASDFVFRYGGEEFLVVLGRADKTESMVVGDKIRKQCEETRFILPGRSEARLTCSIGLAIHDGHPDYNHTLRAADRAIYEAKEHGRNRIVMAGTG
jgi:diguanylate cyclase